MSHSARIATAPMLRMSAVLVAICLGGSVTGATAAAGGAPLPASRFAQVVELARTGADPVRRDFARIALQILIDANQDEAGRVIGTGHATPEQRKQAARWRSGALGYVEHLRQVASRIDTAQDLEIIPDADGGVRVVIDDTQVMLSSPRTSQQRVMELAIADALCRTHDCGRPEPTFEEKAEVAQASLKQQWEFGDKTPPTLASSDGLQCSFSDYRHLKLKQTACNSLLRELRLLSEGLKSLALAGAAVDWSHLMLKQAAGEEFQQVVYDREGHYFQMRAPNLSAAPALWLNAIPWLQGRIKGQARTYLISPPELVVYRVPAHP